MAQRISAGREIPSDLTERLFPAAFACWDEKGFDRTTMDDIAARAGVARATLYYYFRGKADLLVFLLERGIELMRSAMAEATQGAGTGRERLERALDRLVDLTTEYATVVRVVIGQFSLIEREQADASERFGRESTDPLRAILEAGIADGTLREHDPEALSAAILGSIIWAITSYADAGRVVPAGHVKEQVRLLALGGLGV